MSACAQGEHIPGASAPRPPLQEPKRGTGMPGFASCRAAPMHACACAREGIGLATTTRTATPPVPERHPVRTPPFASCGRPYACKRVGDRGTVPRSAPPPPLQEPRRGMGRQAPSAQPSSCPCRCCRWFAWWCGPGVVPRRGVGSSRDHVEARRDHGETYGYWSTEMGERAAGLRGHGRWQRAEAGADVGRRCGGWPRLPAWPGLRVARNGRRRTVGGFHQCWPGANPGRRGRSPALD